MPSEIRLVYTVERIDINWLTNNFKGFSQTDASKLTSLFKYSSVKSSPFLIYKNLTSFFVISISSSLGHAFLWTY